MQLTDEEVTELCDAARKAAKPKARRTPFTWRGRRYVVRFTAFRMLVDTIDGRPVACRYF